MADPMREILRRIECWRPDDSGAELVKLLDDAGIDLAAILPDIRVLNPDAALTLSQWL